MHKYIAGSGLAVTFISPEVSTALMKVVPAGVVAQTFSRGLLRASCYPSDSMVHLAFFISSSNGCKAQDRLEKLSTVSIMRYLL